MRKKILIVSYYANMPGACQAEWIDDKIKSMLNKGHSIVVVSSICAMPYKIDNVRHIRVPSLSKTDFKDEINRIKAAGFGVDKYLYFLVPIVYSFGFIVDVIQTIATKGIGEGRWSWVFTSFFPISIAQIRFKTDMILSTGGPASAHISSIVMSKIFKKPIIVELQDPLSGGDIGRNKAAAGWLYKVEKFIIKYATKTIYVTNAAAEYATQQFNSTKIEALYPGAWDFNLNSSNENPSNLVKYKLIHLGSLYATRNFDPIIKAIDLLINNNEIEESEIELLNLGHVAPEIRELIEKKPYVKILPPVSRVEALKIAANCSVLLLIQNQDDRSQVTIPFKTYDYLNLNTKILGLLNSEELSNLLKDSGHIACDLQNIEKIADGLKILLKGDSSLSSKNIKIDSIIQTEKLIELV